MHSFAEHNEDLIIDELLNGQYEGIWVDVGAWHWQVASVSKIFYDRGMYGINIEPNPQRYHELVSQRPNDINLNVACGDKEGTLKLFMNDGLTTAVEEVAIQGLPTLDVRMTTLEKICDEHVKDKSISWLKLDCETFEKQVIMGMNWDKYKPRVLCIEATLPNTTIPCYDTWEPLVIDNYSFVKWDADGYNRFYVRKNNV